VIGRVNDLLLLELDDGQGYVLAYLVDPAVGWTPQSNEPNVVRAWIHRGDDTPRLLTVEDNSQFDARGKQELAVFDSELTRKDTKKFSGLRLAGRGWQGELTTVRIGERIRAVDWRAQDAWFGGIVKQRYRGELTQLYALGSHVMASFPAGELLTRAGWTSDASQADPAQAHNLAEVLDPLGQRVRYYWPRGAGRPRTPGGE